MTAPEITVTTTDKTTTVHAPYHPDLPRPARAIGGDHKGNGKWVFDQRDDQRVRDLLTEVYGTDGTPGQTVTVKYHLGNATGHIRRPEHWRFGRAIATRKHRDDPVRLGTGVILLQGGFTASAGSVKNPDLGARENTLVEIRDVPAAHPHLLDDEDIIDVIKDTSVNTDALRAERAQLQTRIEEINSILDAQASTYRSDC